jgi:hypothetical protein
VAPYAICGSHDRLAIIARSYPGGHCTNEEGARAEPSSTARRGKPRNDGLATAREPHRSGWLSSSVASPKRRRVGALRAFHSAYARSHNSNSASAWTKPHKLVLRGNRGAWAKRGTLQSFGAAPDLKSSISFGKFGQYDSSNLRCDPLSFGSGRRVERGHCSLALSMPGRLDTSTVSHQCCARTNIRCAQSATPSCTRLRPALWRKEARVRCRRPGRAAS